MSWFVYGSVKYLMEESGAELSDTQRQLLEWSCHYPSVLPSLREWVLEQITTKVADQNRILPYSSEGKMCP